MGDEGRSAALIVGSNGIIGRNLLRHLDTHTDWVLHPLARHHPPGTPQAIAVDLLDREAAFAAIGQGGPFDYLFFAALVDGFEPAAQVAPNLAILRNAVDATIQASPGLKRVCLVQGNKWYGSHLGPFRTPAREDDPRHAPPNFYYDQHDWLSARQAGQGWDWVTLRPHFIAGFNQGNPHNMVMAVGVYAAVQKALGADALDFPGTAACYGAVSMATDATLLARAMHWAATSPACANQDYNIHNGEYFRWSNIWPRIAAAFGMTCGAVRPVRLSEYMADKEPIWAGLARGPGLQDVVSWRWADFLFRSDWDALASTIKARRHGFTACLDTEDALLAMLDEYRAAKLLP